jgi:hypothetical protein
MVSFTCLPIFELQKMGKQVNDTIFYFFTGQRTP